MSLDERLVTRRDDDIDEVLGTLAATDAEADWERFLAREGPWLRTVVAQRLSRRSDVDDAYQDALLAIRQRLGSYTAQGPAAARRWLRMIAQADNMRRAGAARTRREQAFARDAQHLAVESCAADPERLAALRQAISSLSEAQREVVELRYLAGHSTLEVAGLLGVREMTVRSRLARALASLRERMGTAAGPAALLLLVGDLHAAWPVMPLAGPVAVGSTAATGLSAAKLTLIAASCLALGRGDRAVDRRAGQGRSSGTGGRPDSATAGDRR